MMWCSVTQAITLPDCGTAADSGRAGVVCVSGENNAIRLPDGQLRRLPQNVTIASVSPDGAHVNYRTASDSRGTRIVVDDADYLLANDLALGLYDRNSRYLAYTEGASHVWLLDMRRNVQVREALCEVDQATELKTLDRLVGLFDLPDGATRVLWHRKTDTVECYRFSTEASRSPDLAEVPVAKPEGAPETPPEVTPEAVPVVTRPVTTGKILSREHVTSKNPGNGVIGILQTTDLLRRGFQIYEAPADFSTAGQLRLVVDGDGATVINVKGHIVCSWDGNVGIPCEDLLFEPPGNDLGLAYIESKTVGDTTWHLVRFGRYAGWIPEGAAGRPKLIEQLAMGS